MRFAFLVLGMLASSVLVGCQSCSHCDGSFVGDDGVTYKPVKPNPIAKAFEKKSCSCKKHKSSKHKGSDNCPFCVSEGEVHDGMNFGSFDGGSMGCSGCGAPSMGPQGCASCGMPSGIPSTSFPMTSGCSSCGGGIPSIPSSFTPQPTVPHDCPNCRNQGGSPMPLQAFPQELSPMPSPAPAPPEEKPAAPGPMPSVSLIPILPSPSAPRHVHWVPTPVK